MSSTEAEYHVDPNDPNLKFVIRLSEEFPDLQPVFKDHKEFNEEILPYVVMDEFSDYVLENFKAGKDSGLLRRFAEVLENEVAHGEDRVATLIRTTFSESIDTYWKDEELHERMVDLLGPHLRQSCTVMPKSLQGKKKASLRRKKQ